MQACEACAPKDVGGKASGLLAAVVVNHSYAATYNQSTQVQLESLFPLTLRVLTGCHQQLYLYQQLCLLEPADTGAAGHP